MRAGVTTPRAQRGFTLLVAAGLLASYLLGVGVVVFLDGQRGVQTEEGRR